MPCGPESSAILLSRWRRQQPCVFLCLTPVPLRLLVGLGWVGVGVNGVAALRVWAPPGVAITTHDALVPDLARDLERPGFGAALTDAGKNR